MNFKILLLTILASTLSGATGIYAPNVSSGTAITSTSDAVILYVDPTGSDANVCTATGTSACLTIQGALNKAPKYLRDRLTVNVAAGTYAGATVSGFTIDPAFRRTTAGILIDGVLANVTPTTGSATGTATAGSAGSGAVFGTLTDGTATWTVNDTALIGKFVVITGGTGSGQVRVITSNTATVLTIAGTWTAPTGTSTYALQSPSVTITSTVAAIPKPQTGADMGAAGLQIVDNVTGASRITLRNIAISIAASTQINALNTGAVDLIQVTTAGTTSALGTTAGLGSSFTVTSSALTGTTGTALSATGSGNVSPTNTLISATGAGNAVVIAGAGTAVLSGCLLKGTFGLQIKAIASVSGVFGTQCDCASAANSACVIAGNSPTLVAANGFNGIGGVVTIGSNVAVTNCSHGIMASGPFSSVGFSASAVLSGNGLTYGVNATQGALISMPTATTTITGVTAEASVDTGATTATWASFAASNDCLANLATGSRICRL